MTKTELIHKLHNIHDNCILGHFDVVKKDASDLIDELSSEPHGEASSVSENEQAKEVCGTCDKYTTCKTFIPYDAPACKIYCKQTD